MHLLPGSELSNIFEGDISSLQLLCVVIMKCTNLYLHPIGRRTPRAQIVPMPRYSAIGILENTGLVFNIKLRLVAASLRNVECPY